MSNRLAFVLGFLLVTAIVVVVVGSWIGASMGLDVQNALSFEGLRWLFVHALDDTHHLLPTCLLLCLLPALLGQSSRPWLIVALALLLMLLLLLFSPVLGLTGHLLPSPFLRGMVPVFAFFVIVLCLLSEWFSGRLPVGATFSRLAQALASSAAWLVIALMALFLFNLIQFVR